MCWPHCQRCSPLSWQNTCNNAGTYSPCFRDLERVLTHTLLGFSPQSRVRWSSSILRITVKETVWWDWWHGRVWSHTPEPRFHTIPMRAIVEWFEYWIHGQPYALREWRKQMYFCASLGSFCQLCKHRPLSLQIGVGRQQFGGWIGSHCLGQSSQFMIWARKMVISVTQPSSVHPTGKVSPPGSIALESLSG